MRPVLPQKEKNYNLLTIYIVIGLICIIGVGIATYNQFFKDEKIRVIFGITDSEKEDKYNDLKNNFNNIFKNNIENNQEVVNAKKIREDLDWVVTRDDYKEQKENYDLNVSIPNINIDNEQIKKYNDTIRDNYLKKIESAKSSVGSVYTLKYKAYIQSDVLSLVIYSELKESSANQKVMVDTYNYDLAQNKEISLEELLSKKDISVSSANDKIKNEIQETNEKNKSLSELGYTFFERDMSSDIYKVENIKQFFWGQYGYIYVVFAYGNSNQTSDMDLVIFM